VSQVLHGVEEGDRVVVSAQFLIDSETNLKAAIASMSTTASGAEPADAVAQTSSADGR
jgi:Cu(I)/Ag(I) efflux system membrane fusion protein